MTSADIHELLNRLAIFPKPYPRNLDGVVKLLERQRWEAVRGENEACAETAEGAACRDQYDAERLDQIIAAAIRARVKS